MTSLGVGWGGANTAPAAHLTPLRARTAPRSTSLRTDSSNPTPGISIGIRDTLLLRCGLGAPGRRCGRALRLLLGELQRAHFARQDGDLTTDATHVTARGQL